MIQPDRSDHLPNISSNRREESVLSRLHIGHSYLTHSFLLKEEEEKPVCIGCDENLTIEHILLHCWDFYDIRRKHYSAENLKVLFRDIPPDKIFDFLREINVFNKIWNWNMKERDLLKIFEVLETLNFLSIWWYLLIDFKLYFLTCK